MYKGLSKYLVGARKDGSVAWDALEDTARNVYGSFKDDCFSPDVVDRNQEDLDNKLGEFSAENLIDEFFDYVVTRAYVSRWAKQPIICELWIEKEALAKTIQAWTANLGVQIRVNKGYSSWTFLYNNVQALIGYLRNHESIKVFYLGDLDPSGVDMERFLHEVLEYFGLDDSKVELSRLAVTDGQVREYHLPPKPEDAETLAKLGRDPRTANYAGEFIVELDALVAFVPQEFRRTITDAIKGVWDRGIYDKLRVEADEKNEAIAKILDEVKEKAREALRDL